jgi:hypothetical protein
MATENSIFAPRESFDDQQEADPFRVPKNVRRQKPTAPQRFPSAQPAARGECKPRASSQHSDDLNVAKGILVGVVLGSICWGLLIGVLYWLVH